VVSKRHVPDPEARVFELREALAQGGDRTRDALRTLFGGERLRVGWDSERGFRVDGWLALTIGREETAREGWTSRASLQGSGGRFLLSPPFDAVLAFAP